MKKVIFIIIFLICGLSYSQKSEYIKNGDLIEMTSKYDNGNIKEHGFFNNGKLHGNWDYYDIDGNIKISAIYSNGVKYGKWVYTNHTSTIIVLYKKGKIDSIYKI